MSLLIIDSHLSTSDKINYINKNDIKNESESKNNIYYLVYLNFSIDDINKLLDTTFESSINLVLTTNQSFKYNITNYLKLINKFNIYYYNDITNLYYYNKVKEYNYLTALTKKIKFLIIEKNEHYFKRLIQDIEYDNSNYKINIITTKNIDILDKPIQINYLDQNLEKIDNNDQNDTLNNTSLISLNKNSTINQKLKFVHISKCAGTVIEDLAKDKGIYWGRFDNSLINENLLKKWRSIKSDIYHLSPTLFENNIYNLDKSTNMKTFCVIREPYSRIVSEVFCNWIGILINNSNPTIIDYNNHISEYLYLVETRFNLQHWWPQHKFIYDADGNKIVDYVLRMDNLNQEFNDLMEEYNLPLQLNYKTNESNKMYGLKDIFINNLSKINKIYKKDFELFGSDMIEVINIKNLIEDNKIVIISYYFLLEEKKIDYKMLEDFVSNYKNMDILFYHNNDDIKYFIEMMNDEKDEKLQNRFKFVKLRIEDLINDFIKIEELNNDNLDNIASLSLPKIIANSDLIKQFDNKSNLILLNARYKIKLDKFSINDKRFNFIIDSDDLNLSEILTIMNIEMLTEYKEIFYTIVNDIKKNKESISPKKLLNNVLLELKNNYSDKIAIMC